MSSDDFDDGFDDSASYDDHDDVTNDEHSGPAELSTRTSEERPADTDSDDTITSAPQLLSPQGPIPKTILFA